MRKKAISVTEAARNFADCVNRAHYQNVTFVLLRNLTCLVLPCSIESRSKCHSHRWGGNECDCKDGVQSGPSRKSICHSERCAPCTPGAKFCGRSRSAPWLG